MSASDAPPRRARAPRGWKDRFLETLRLTANVSAAAKAAGVDRRTPYRAREGRSKQAQAFAEAWDQAIDEAVDMLEQEAWRRAVSGVNEPVFHKGVEVGTIRRYSDKLLETLLKAHRPERYSERFRLEHGGPAGGPIKIEDPHGELVDKLIAMAERLEGATAERGKHDDQPEEPEP